MPKQDSVTGLVIVVGKIDQAFAGLDKTTLAKGIASGLTEMAKQGRTAIKKNIRARYALKAREIVTSQTPGRGMYVKAAKPWSLVASVIATGRRVPLTEYEGFRVRKKSGLKAMIVRGRPFEIRHGFVLRGGADAKRIPMARRRNVDRYRGKGSSDLPIEMKGGPSLPQLFGAKKTFRDVERFIQRKLDKVVGAKIQFQIDRHAGRIPRR